MTESKKAVFFQKVLAIYAKTTSSKYISFEERNSRIKGTSE